MAGREPKVDGERAEVDQFAVFGSQHVSTHDRVGGDVDEDLDCRGGLAEPVVGVPAARVRVADVEIDAGGDSFGFEHADAGEFRDREHRSGNTGVVRDSGRRFQHVRRGDFPFEHRDRGQRHPGRVRRVTSGVHRRVGDALEVGGNVYTA